MRTVTVREHARLTTQKLSASDIARPLDRAQISVSAFDWLCELSSRLRVAGAALVQTENRTWLRLDNFVGVVQTPCGTVIEILPKHYDTEDAAPRGRLLLRRLILDALDLPARVTEEASLEIFDGPISEWLIRQFLRELDVLIKRGLRFHYQRLEEEARYLRGQLNVSKQMLQWPGREHRFHICHDLHLPDRPENRLLRRALDQVCKATQDPANWRLAHELRAVMSEVPLSANIEGDFRRWSHDRLMAHYEAVEPWCRLILGHQVPLATAGTWQGISLLFPMEKLFERSVAKALRQLIDPHAKLRTPARSEYLCRHGESRIFRLEPDMLVTHGENAWVLDCKWKRVIDDRESKYGLSQPDFYQLFAYGHRYMAGKGDLFLVFPLGTDFPRGRLFDFDAGMRLWLVPFDIDGAGFDIKHLSALPLRQPCPERVCSDPASIEDDSTPVAQSNALAVIGGAPKPMPEQFVARETDRRRRLVL
ncbi:McrC family protein [Variovorax paradoxus]